MIALFLLYSMSKDFFDWQASVFFQHLDDSLSEKQSVPACVNAIVWLGLEAYQENWVESVTSQEAWYSVFGETYENEIRLPVVGWTKDGCPRPNFSNAGGNVSFFDGINQWKPWSWSWYFSHWSLKFHDHERLHTIFLIYLIRRNFRADKFSRFSSARKLEIFARIYFRAPSTRHQNSVLISRNIAQNFAKTTFLY